METLFELPKQTKTPANAPLADRMRPQSLEEVIGQQNLLGPGKALRRQIESDHVPSLILWGPPGSGKTTLARVIAHHTQSSFHSLSAVLSGVKELKEIIEIAKKEQRLSGKKTLLFIDEIHRWNKSQQDALLPHLEDGTITLIGATTENPSFEVIGPLLSRMKVYPLQPLTQEDLSQVVARAASDSSKGLGKLGLKLAPDALEAIVQTSDGDARRALNTLEIATNLVGKEGKTLTAKIVEEAIQKKSLLYDKGGEEHYNIISAFIKSMRGSDPNAAIYWMARMLEAGEEPLFVARRMVIFASEDIGNADPRALQVALNAMQSFEFIGMPEGWIPLAQAATYLAAAPKSNASYRAYLEAKKDVDQEGVLPTPLHIRNAPTKLLKKIGYGKDYQYPHDFKGNHVEETYLPEKLKDRVYYHPTENGLEKAIKTHLQQLKKK